MLKLTYEKQGWVGTFERIARVLVEDILSDEVDTSMWILRDGETKYREVTITRCDWQGIYVKSGDLIAYWDELVGLGIDE